jgi:hypothetical protein
MKRILIIIAVVVIILLGAMPILRMYTKSHSPQELASYEGSNGLKIEVVYSRPFKKDRLIFGPEEKGALVPYGKKWRTGANEATEITINQEVTIEGSKLSEGTYSLYTIPEANEWTVAFNKRTDYWGINPFGETFMESEDALRVKAKVSALDEVQEQFVIRFEEDTTGRVMMHFQWDQTNAYLSLQP